MGADPGAGTVAVVEVTLDLDLDLDLARPVLAELARALVDLPPIGAWVELAACGPLAGAQVWRADDEPDVDELAVAERVCRRCPVRPSCHRPPHTP